MYLVPYRECGSAPIISSVRRAIDRLGKGTPPLTAEDLTDEGWQAKKRELESRGVDPDRYLVRQLPKTIRQDPALRRAADALQAGKSEKAKAEGAFFKWGYRATLTGVCSVLVVGVLRISPAWHDAHTVVMSIGALAGTAIVVLTGIALFMLVRYLRAPSN
jgi:hypothetical protein